MKISRFAEYQSMFPDSGFHSALCGLVSLLTTIIQSTHSLVSSQCPMRSLARANLYQNFTVSHNNLQKPKTNQAFTICIQPTTALLQGIWYTERNISCPDNNRTQDQSSLDTFLVHTWLLLSILCNQDIHRSKTDKTEGAEVAVI